MQIVQSRNRIEKQIDQSVVEIILAIPVLILGILFLLEIGRMGATLAFVNLASREGARYGAAVVPTENGILNYYDCNGIRERTIRHTTLTDLSGSNVNISYETGTGGALKYASCEDLAAFRMYDSITFGDNIVVEVSKDMNLLISSLGLDLEPITISSSSSRSISLSLKLAGQ